MSDYAIDYLSDIGSEFKYVKPLIVGINRNNNQFLTAEQCLNIVSQITSITPYKEIVGKPIWCSLPRAVRKRRLVIETATAIVEAEYPLPFKDIRFTYSSQGDTKVQTIGERLNPAYLQAFIDRN